MPSCQSYGCSNKSSGKRRNLNVSYFHFPDSKKDKARAERWLHNIGTGYSVESFNFKGKVVCSSLFHANCFEVDMMAKRYGIHIKEEKLEVGCCTNHF